MPKIILGLLSGWNGTTDDDKLLLSTTASRRRIAADRYYSKVNVKEGETNCRGLGFLYLAVANATLPAVHWLLEILHFSS